MNKSFVVLLSIFFIAGCSSSSSSEEPSSNSSNTSDSNAESANSENLIESFPQQTATLNTVEVQTSSGDGLVDALASDLLSLPGTEFDESEAICAGNIIIQDIGKERLNELGVTAEDTDAMLEASFSDEEVEVLTEKIYECIDS